MVATPWEAVMGRHCECCETNYATHIYGVTYLCCECHAGENGLVPAAEATRIQQYFAKHGELPPEEDFPF